MFETGLVVKFKNVEFMPSNEVSVKILDKLKQNNSNLCSIIFGRNGAGKSTICKSINNIIKDKEDFGCCVELVDEDEYQYTQEKLNNIRIFSEFFIDENIRFKENGLETIVLLGEDVQIDDKITEIENKIKEVDELLEKIDLSVFNDNKNTSNPEYNLAKMIKTLRQNDNWASRKKQINGLKNNAAVNESVVFDIYKNHSKTIKISEFNDILSNYLSVRANNELCNYRFPDLKIIDLDKIVNILNIKINKRSEDKIAKEIYNVISEFGDSRIIEIQDRFESKIDICPYCFQPIDEKYRVKVIKAIKKVLSKESEEIKNKVQSLYINIFKYEELPIIIDDNLKLKLFNAVNRYNEEADLINSQLSKKNEDIYSSFELPNNHFKEAFDELYKIISKIQTCIEKHNDDVKKIKDIRNDLSEYNNYLAWLSIKDEYKEYQKNLKEKQNLEKKFDALTNDRTMLENQLIEFQMKKQKIEIAVKDINDSLSYIFLSKDRLQIVGDNDCYKVESKGKSIKLEDLSTGERNIIALCYFYTYIGIGKKATDRFKDEYLICIDDPITSFDHENKVGIYVFLRMMIKKVLSGNRHSRFVFLTHAYDVAYNLDKIVKDVNRDLNICKRDFDIGKKLEYFEIDDYNISQGRNQYKFLLKEVFDYANNNNSAANDYSIGNMIRRMLEMFSSFEFNTNFESLNYKLGEDSLCNLLNNYMFRIVANNESHSMINAYAYDQIDRFETFTHEEKVRTAKLSLLLIRNLNENHLKSYLDDDINTIMSWEEDLRELLID